MTEKKEPAEDVAAKLFAETPASSSSILSDKEIEEARAEARRRVASAMKVAETERFIKEEEERIRRAEGKRTGTADMDEEVDILVDLPEFCDRLMINGESYWHGYSYKVPRHMANSMRESMQRAHHHQMTIDGKSLEEAYRRNNPQMLTPAGVQPLQEAAA